MKKSELVFDIQSINEEHARYFLNRGINIRSKEDYRKFTDPNYESDLIDPFLLKDMDKAVSRIKKALDDNEKILIYTDYDCDGIPGGTILYDFFKKIQEYKESTGIKFVFNNYIPHRHNEGYGLHQNVLDKYIASGFTLMITADLGITNVKEIEYAESMSMNVILTDHHLPIKIKDKKTEKEVLPPAFAIINVQLAREVYENKNLCGAATAWKLVQAFLSKYRAEYNIQEGWEKWLLDLVALSTVADMMSLTGENRALVYYGLKVFRKSNRPGLLKMLSLAKEKLINVNEKTFAFTVAPRINAASRLDHPMKGFALLSNYEGKGQASAEELEDINKLRKSTVEDITKYLNFNLDEFNQNKIIFIGNEKWPVGIVGLLAQKMVEFTGKTSFVYGVDEKGIVRGSSRSHHKSVSVMNITSSASKYLLHFGGHEAAGGFSLEEKNLDKLAKSLEQSYTDLYSDINFLENGLVEIISDYDFKFGENLKSVYDKFKLLAPFGIGHTAPIIKIEGSIEVRRFGQGSKHLEINISQNSTVFAKIIKWNIDDKTENKIRKAKFVFSNIEEDNWGGKNGHRLMYLDSR